MTPHSTLGAWALGDWLRCPTCHADMASIDERTLGCAAGHRFDRNKHGHLTLLPQTHRHNGRHIGDDAAMLDARRLVLESGLYDPILRAVASLVPVDREVSRIADLGCGSGHYLRAVLSELRERDAASSPLRDTHPPRRALACDLSAQAVRRTMRLLAGPAAPDRVDPVPDHVHIDTDRSDADAVRPSPAPVVDGLVADIWAPSPLRDGAADLVLNVFAPRNLPEFARVVAAGGCLISVVPAARHFRELTAGGLALRVPAGKAESLTAEAERTGAFHLAERAHVERTIHPEGRLRAALTGMGPAARHYSRTGTATGSQDSSGARTNPKPSLPDSGDQPVTIAVDVLRFLRV